MNLKQYLIKSVNTILFALIISYFSVTIATAQENSITVIGDYISFQTLPQKHIELSINYFVINDTIDVLDFREQEIETVSYTYRSIALNDMEGCNVLMNYGLFKDTTLQAGYTYRSLDYIFRSMDLNSFTLSLKQAIHRDNHTWIPGLALDGGFRYNFAYDLIGGDETEINTLLGRFPSNNIIVKYDNKDVYFFKTADEYIIVPRSRNGIVKSSPQVSLTDLNDKTVFLRLTTGKGFKFIIPAIYLEYGMTWIDSRIDSTLTEYIPELSDSFRLNIPELPVNLNRKESYMKTGLGLTFKMPFKTTFILGYDYIRFLRDSDLDYIDYNHIFRVDIRYNIIKRMDLVVGAIMYNRQLNGIIPFAYNKYTQTTFDHSYGRANLGISYVFGR